MDYSGVNQSLTWIQPPYLRELDAANKYLYEATKSYPNRILGFGWADPNLGAQKSVDMAKRCLYEYGFYGVKLNGAQNSFYIDNQKLVWPIIEEIVKANRIAAFHIGGDAYEHTHPFRLAKIAREFPQLQILMVHMGGAAFADLSDACIEVASQHSNIHLIGSAIRDVSIYKAIKILGSERVSFGSDTPFALMHASVAMYKSLLKKDFNEQDEINVMGGNIARLFKIV
jgi:predicted TIM-barrel fold metal-dependent hydrolase